MTWASEDDWRDHLYEIPNTLLAGKDHSMWLPGARPPMGPVSIGEIKAGFPVRVMKPVVHRESAG